jgi:hypothetical protein
VRLARRQSAATLVARLVKETEEAIARTLLLKAES